jgi:glucokinase
MILAGDIGGTNTRLALFGDDPHEPVRLEVYASAGHAGLEEMLAEFLQGAGRVRRAAFGIAGPVRDGRSTAVNLPWEVDARAVGDAFGLESVTLLNDLDANARGLAALRDEDFATLSRGTPDPEGNIAVLSAGTGLGQAIVAGGRVVPGEGGHVDFAPRGELQIELLRHLARRFEHVSLERVLSGQGLSNLYGFVVETGRGAPLPGEPGPPEITAAALDGSSPACALVVDLFASIYGAAAGNVALTVLATGGVFLGGGIAPRLLPKLSDGTFLQAFQGKGRFAPVLLEIPVKVVVNDRAALIGAGLTARLPARGVAS